MSSLFSSGDRQESRRRSLLALEPDLGEDLNPAEATAARRVAVTLERAPQGPWRPDVRVAASTGNLGFLLLEGLLMRSVTIADTRCTELLGPGDLLRPWSMDAADMASVPVEADWRVVERPAKFAVLDSAATRELGRWPQITCELMDRVVRRARWLSFQLAVCHTRQVKRRLLMILWHFADRWGRVNPEGTVLDMRLSHATLGEIVGARRPSVTTALGELRAESLLRYEDGSYWLLLGGPPRFVEEPALGGSEAD